MKVVDKRLIFINSEDRVSGSIQDFSIEIPSHLLVAEKHQFTRLVLNDLVMPYTWYNVQASNNTFTIQEPSATATMALELGSYHTLQLRDHIKVKLNGSGLSGTYTVSYYEQSGHFIIQSTSSSTFTLTNNTAYRLLGFEKGVTSIAQSVNGTMTLESTKSVNMMFTEALFLHIDLPNTNMNKGTGDKTSFHISNAFAKIPINTSPFNNIIYLNTNDDYIVNTPSLGTQLRLMVTTLDHQPIELNDDYSLTLKLEVLEDDQRNMVAQNSNLANLLSTLILQQHVIHRPKFEGN
jgi:hypothetical protein